MAAPEPESSAADLPVPETGMDFDLFGPLGARLEAVQKFSFKIKNKSAGSCSAVFLAAAWKQK